MVIENVFAKIGIQHVAALIWTALRWDYDTAWNNWKDNSEKPPAFIIGSPFPDTEEYSWTDNFCLGQINGCLLQDKRKNAQDYKNKLHESYCFSRVRLEDTL